MIKTKLLSIIDYTVYSGPHAHDIVLREELIRRGIETTTLLPDEAGDALERLRKGGVQVITYPSHRAQVRSTHLLNHFRYALKCQNIVRYIRGIIRQRGIDLVQLADPLHPHGAIAARLERVPLVTHIVGKGGAWSVRLMGSVISCRMADVLLTNGSATTSAYPGLALWGRKMFAYFSPIDIEKFRPDAERRKQARAQLGIRNDQVAIGCIGRLHPEKDHFTCIRALAQIRRRLGNVRFVMMGAVHPGCERYLEHLRETAASLDLAFGHDVVHVNAGPDVANLAQAFDIGWSAGFQEGATSSVGEAMALGVPVVGAGNGAVREMIEEGVSGYLFAPRQAGELARLSEPLIEDPVLRGRMSEGARRRAVKLFSKERCAAIHLEAYEVALSRCRERSSSLRVVNGAQSDGLGT